MRGCLRFGGLFILALVLANVPATALADAASGTVSVTASVLPNKYVYVNNDAKIVKIISNTSQDAPPIFMSNNLPLPSPAVTMALLDQYNAIKSTTNLGGLGQVYPAVLPAPKQEPRNFWLGSLPLSILQAIFIPRT